MEVLMRAWLGCELLGAVKAQDELPLLRGNILVRFTVCVMCPLHCPASPQRMQVCYSSQLQRLVLQLKLSNAEIHAAARDVLAKMVVTTSTKGINNYSQDWIQPS